MNENTKAVSPYAVNGGDIATLAVAVSMTLLLSPLLTGIAAVSAIAFAPRMLWQKLHEAR